MISGCSRAEVDVAQLFDYFAVNGWQMTDSIAEADLVVVSGCAFDARSERTSLRLLDVIDEKRPSGSRLVVTGCMAHVCAKEIESRFDATLVFSRDRDVLDEVVKGPVALASVADPPSIRAFVDRATGVMDDRDRHPDDGFALRQGRAIAKRVGLAGGDSYLQPTGDYCTLRVARGCSGLCSYCVIRSAHGPLRSKPIEQVVAEFEQGLDHGHEDFKLVAQDLGAYGQDAGSSIVELLAAILEHEGEYRLTLVDINAKWLVAYDEAFVGLLAAHPSKVRHVAVPIQSGSERMLDLMKRGHTAAEAQTVLVRLREALPGAALATQVMVGFPGETEQDLEDTIRLLRAVRFDRVDVFDYSERPNTLSAGLPDKVPAREVRARSRRLRREFVGGRDALGYTLRHLVGSERGEQP